jgi:hypothetical protein
MIKLTHILSEVLNPNQKEMVDGIVDMLNQIKDIDNRQDIALDRIEDFKKEGIVFDYNEFLERCGLEPVDIEEALTPMQKLARKRAMAGKQRLIQRKKQRTMLRKKGSEQLYKKAYKAAYRDVYEFFRNRLFPDVPKEELSIIQKKQIEKWVAKKKKKVLKRARFKYLPMFREKEAEKFGGKSNIFKKDGVDESGKDKSEKNYKDWKSTNETVDKSDLKNAKFRLKKVLKYLDIEYKETRGGKKYVQINYIPVTTPQWYGPEFVNVRYDDEKDLQNIGKALKLKLKESVSEVAKRDYKAEYKKFQSSTKAKKYRAELNKYNRDKGTYGNGDGKDASHKGGKIVGFESEKKNRGRAEKSRLKKGKK